MRPSAKVKRFNFTVIEATPLTRPPGSELAITPATVAPLSAITQSPSAIAVASVQVNGSPVLFDFVVSVDVVKTGIDLPDARVNVRGGGGGGGSGVPAGGTPACPGAVAGPAAAGTLTPEGGAAGEDASEAEGVPPSAGDDAGFCSEAFALPGGLALSCAVSEPDFAAAFELDEAGGLEVQLS